MTKAKTWREVKSNTYTLKTSVGFKYRADFSAAKASCTDYIRYNGTVYTNKFSIEIFQASSFGK